MTMPWKKWVLDVTFGDPVAFCPYEDDGTVVVGLSLMSGKCPGILEGVYHSDGIEEAQKWVAAHPNWREEHEHATSNLQTLQSPLKNGKA